MKPSVGQVIDSRHPVDIQQLPAEKVILFPNVSGAFLWPFSGQPHIRNEPLPWFHAGPYPSDLGDRYLDRHILQGTAPEMALEEYCTTDIARKRNIDRLFTIMMEQLHARDMKCGTSCRNIIADNLRIEAVFQSPAQFELRLFRHLAETIYPQLGVSRTMVEAMNSNLTRSPFPPLYAPIHPSIARHFGLTYAGETRTYLYFTGEMLTFREAAGRYLNYDFNESLLHGITLSWTAHDASTRAQSRKLIEEGLQRSTGSAYAFDGLARLSASEGNRKDEVEFLRKAHNFNPSDAVRCSWFGTRLMETGAFAEAETVIRDAVALWPANMALRILLALILLRSGKPSEAGACAVEAAELRSVEVHVIRDLFEVLHAVKRHDVAVRILRDTLEIFPNDASLWFCLARSEQGLGDLPSAIASALKAASLESGMLDATRLAADLLIDAGMLDEAEKFLEDAIARFSTAVDFHRRLAIVLVRRDNRNAAAAILRQAIRIDPAEPQCLSFLANLSFELVGLRNKERDTIRTATV
jgi:tetratricopeptide (TPR) repeat protein